MSGGGFTDGLLLSVGTFSAVRVPPPRDVNNRTVRWSLILAPLVGAGISFVAGGVGWIGWWLAGQMDNRTMLVAVVAAWLVVGALVWSTRGLHLDGLADLTDGLGSGRSAADAIEAMRDPRIGAFGAIALVVVLGAQAASVAVLIERGTVLPALVAVGIAARAPLAWWARRGTPASTDGLGRSVVGAFGPMAAGVLMVTWLVVAVGVAAAWIGMGGGGVSVPVAVVTIGLGVGLAAVVRRRAIRRLEALTGDTLGATIEAAATAMLVVLALAG